MCNGIHKSHPEDHCVNVTQYLRQMTSYILKFFIDFMICFQFFLFLLYIFFPSSSYFFYQCRWFNFKCKNENVIYSRFKVQFCIFFLYCLCIILLVLREELNIFLSHFKKEQFCKYVVKMTISYFDIFIAVRIHREKKIKRIFIKEKYKRKKIYKTKICVFINI